MALNGFLWFPTTIHTGEVFLHFFCLWELQLDARHNTSTTARCVRFAAKSYFPVSAGVLWDLKITSGAGNTPASSTPLTWIPSRRRCPEYALAAFATFLDNHFLVPLKMSPDPNQINPLSLFRCARGAQPARLTSVTIVCPSNLQVDQVRQLSA